MNEFAANPQVWPALVVFVLIALPVFSYFYNLQYERMVSRLNGAKDHTSLYVVGGVLVTLAAVALISWKAALLCLFCFVLSGPGMIAGEFKRTKTTNVKNTVTKLRRKRLPYAANSCIEDAHDYVKEAQRLIDTAFKANGKNIESALPMAEASQKLSLAFSRLVELKSIQEGE